MKGKDLKQFHIPDSPGVYYFLKYNPSLTLPLSRKGTNLHSPLIRGARGVEILYVGKATSLRDRVKSYFSKDILLTRGPKIAKMLEEAQAVKYVQTDSVLEALILEANEIKKLQPIYNSIQKDDKSYNFVVITDEKFPRVLVRRGRELSSPHSPSPRSRRGDDSRAASGGEEVWKVFGPFPHGSELREALKIVRKIFPYRDEKCQITPKHKPCFNAQIGLCPGPCAGLISAKDYKKIIKHLTLFFEGKKERLISTLEKEMRASAKALKFEEADKIKRQIFALNHIQDVALIKNSLEPKTKNLKPGFRIEAYDIAHISGTNVVGVMTVVTDGELDKAEYRKFKLKLDKNDDVGNLREVLTRRLAHPEWRAPDLIVVDGGLPQLKVAESLTLIPVVAVTKDERHKAKTILNLKDQGLAKAVILANFEAHRFAIKYHRLLRTKGFRI